MAGREKGASRMGLQRECGRSCVGAALEFEHAELVGAAREHGAGRYSVRCGPASGQWRPRVRPRTSSTPCPQPLVSTNVSAGASAIESAPAHVECNA